MANISCWSLFTKVVELLASLLISCVRSVGLSHRVVHVADKLQKQAEMAIYSSGCDTKPALEVVKTAASTAGEVQKYIEGAKPSISGTLQNVLSSDPIVLATGAGALWLLYSLAPPLLSSLSTAARGFKAVNSTEPLGNSGPLKNTGRTCSAEAEIAALKILVLKGINKGCRIIFMDLNGDVAKAIARIRFKQNLGS